ncbi:hypothetical protein ACWD1Y_23695 [Streptomyces sp. NPDC002814]
MTENAWTVWPSREALSRKERAGPRRLFASAVRLVVAEHPTTVAGAAAGP